MGMWAGAAGGPVVAAARAGAKHRFAASRSVLRSFRHSTFSCLCLLPPNSRRTRRPMSPKSLSTARSAGRPIVSLVRWRVLLDRWRWRFPSLLARCCRSLAWCSGWSALRRFAATRPNTRAADGCARIGLLSGWCCSARRLRVGITYDYLTEVRPRAIRDRLLGTAARSRSSRIARLAQVAGAARQEDLHQGLHAPGRRQQGQGRPLHSRARHGDVLLRRPAQADRHDRGPHAGGRASAWLTRGRGSSWPARSQSARWHSPKMQMKNPVVVSPGTSMRCGEVECRVSN